MGDRSTFGRIEDFSGGMRSARNPYGLLLNEAVEIQNAYWVDKAGAFMQRSGYRALNDTLLAAAAFQGFHRYYKSGTGYFVAAINGKIHRGTNAAGLATPLATGLATTSGQVYFVTMNNTVYFCDGDTSTDKLMSLTDTGDLSRNVASDGSAPLLVESWQNRLVLVLANDVLSISELGAPTTHGTTAGWTQSCYPNDNDSIVAIKGYGNYLFVFKRRHIYVVSGTGPRNYRIDILSTSIGCRAPRSIIEIEGVLYFGDATGMHTAHGLTLDYRRSGKKEPLTADVSDVWNNISSSMLSYVACGAHRANLWVAYCDSTKAGAYNQRVMVFDTTTERVHSIFTMPCAMFVTCDGGTDGGELYHASSSTTGKIYRQNIGKNDAQVSDGTGGNLVECIWKSRPLPIDSFPFYADLCRLWLEAWTGGSAITVNIYVGNETTPSFTDSVTFTAEADATWGDTAAADTDLVWDTSYWADIVYQVQDYALGVDAARSFTIEIKHSTSDHQLVLHRLGFESKRLEWD